MCIDGTIDVSSTTLMRFEFFATAMKQIDPEDTKRIDIMEKYADVAALFIYLYRGTFEKKDIAAILMLFDKWGGPINEAVRLFRSISDLACIPNHASGYITKVLTELCTSNRYRSLKPEMFLLPDYVVGKLAKVIYRDLIPQPRSASSAKSNAEEIVSSDEDNEFSAAFAAAPPTGTGAFGTSTGFDSSSSFGFGAPTFHA